MYITDARARLISGMVIVSLKVVNRGDRADTLLGAASSAGTSAVMLETVTHRGVTRTVEMSQGVRIPPRGTVEFGPGARQIVLMEASQPSADCRAIELHLRFERAGTVRVSVPLVPSTG